MGTTMTRPLSRISLWLALLAMGLQVLLPGAMASARTGGSDLARYFCAPAGSALDPAAEAAAWTIARLLGEELPEDDPQGGDCPLCTLAHAVPLPEAASPAQQVHYGRQAEYTAFAPGHAHRPHGPPCGSRAPPALT